MSYNEPLTATHRGDRDKRVSDSIQKLVQDTSTILDVSGNDDFYNIATTHRTQKSILKKRKEENKNKTKQLMQSQGRDKRIHKHYDDDVSLEEIKIQIHSEQVIEEKMS